MATYPLATLAPTIDNTGISAPSYSDIYQSLIASFQAIYGSSIYIAPDSQDGQWLAILAQAINDSNQAAVACFQAFSPTYAQGAGLSSLVKLNGLLRNTATNSTAVGNVVGTVGTVITNGVVQDANGNLWNLPASVTIPIGGSIAVTVTAQNAGNLTAPAGTISKVYNPQLGWQSFTSTADAVVGSPIELDATLRARQGVSSSLPALGIKEAIYAAIANVTGVTRSTVYENDTGATDSNGIPAHTISAVVDGGSIAAITAAIASKKPPGGQTYGSTSGVVYDQYGLPVTINYYVLAHVQIYFAVTIKALPGYVSTTGTALIAALVAFAKALAIGEGVYTSQAQAAAGLINQAIGQTYYITAFTLGVAPAPVGTANIAIAFNQIADCATANCALTVT
jgi:uncharacterized phage protein gp47/JayE